MSIRRGNYFVIYMFQQDVDNMKEWVLQYPNKETGGDLFGLWSGEGDNAVIHVVLGPGRNCTHGDYHFYQDVDYLEKVGSLLTQDYMLGHIGEWHSHHRLKLDSPSEGDCRTIERNFPQRACGFFLMIANIICKDEVSLSPYVFKEGSRRVSEGEVLVIPERSPFATVPSISQIINEGNEVKPRKEEKEKEHRKEKVIIIFLPDDTMSTGMDTGSTEFFSNDLQNNSVGLEDVDLSSTRMSKEFKVSLPTDSDFKWYSKEENRNVLQGIVLGLLSLVGKVKITFEKSSKDMNMEFENKGRKMTLSFGPYFPSSGAKLKVKDTNTSASFYLYKRYNSSTYNLSSFLKEIGDCLKNSVYRYY